MPISPGVMFNSGKQKAPPIGISAALTVRRDVLESWLKISGYTKSRLAQELEISKGRISQLLNSDQEPSARLIAGLLSLTNLPFDRLFSVRERRAILRRMRLAQRRRRHSKRAAAAKPVMR